MSHDVTVVRSIAVSPADVVDAYVYTRENPGQAVVRLTPPFHGRMRARLHAFHVDDSTETNAVHIDPATLLEPAALERYPTLERVTATLETAEITDTAVVREHYDSALERWRERARANIRQTATLASGDGQHRVRVVCIG